MAFSKLPIIHANTHAHAHTHTHARTHARTHTHTHANIHTHALFIHAGTYKYIIHIYHKHISLGYTCTLSTHTYTFQMPSYV